MPIQGLLDFTKFNPEALPLHLAVLPADIRVPVCRMPAHDVAGVVPADSVALDNRRGRFGRTVPVPCEHRRSADVQESLVAGRDGRPWSSRSIALQCEAGNPIGYGVVRSAGISSGMRAEVHAVVISVGPYRL